MINNLYRFHSVVFTGTQFGGTVTLGGTTQSSVSNNPEVQQDYVDGNIFASLVTIRSYAQEANFTTTNIDDAIKLMGTSSSCIDAGSTLEIYFAKIDPCAAGGIATGAVHKRLTLGSTTSVGGVMLFQSLNTEHRGDSLYSFQTIPKFDGINAPITIANNVALPAGPIDNRKRFTLGPLTVAGHTIEGIKSANIEGGISIDRDSADSSIFDEYIGIQQASQKMTVAGFMDDWFDPAKLGLIANQANHVDTKLVLRQRSTSDPSGFELPATTNHVAITMSGKAVATSIVEASGIDKATNGFDIYGEHDGTNTPLVALADQAY